MPGTLSMRGHVDNVFKSVQAQHIGKGGAYVNGVWTPVTYDPVPFMVNVQPLSEREIDFLTQGGERIVDGRRIYVNSGDMSAINLDGEWVFFGQRWKIIRTDYRPLRDYCKVIVDRIDNQ